MAALKVVSKGVLMAERRVAEKVGEMAVKKD